MNTFLNYAMFILSFSLIHRWCHRWTIPLCGFVPWWDRFNKHPLSRLMKMSLQIWLAGSVVTDGIITISMLYLVSLSSFVSVTELNLLPTSSAEERTQ